MASIFAWTAQRIQLLIDMHGQGRSMEDMAYALGTTRGSVAGKIDRIRKESDTAVPKRVIVKKKVLPPTSKKAPSIPKETPPVALLDLRPGACRWPLDNGMFCGQCKVKGWSYCAKHSMMASRNALVR